jgi:hypothetical protein
MGLQLAPDKKPEKTSFLIMLDADNLEHLQQIARYLDEKDIEHHLFFEPDEPINSHTAICTEPLPLDMRKHFKKFKLWKI